MKRAALLFLLLSGFPRAAAAQSPPAEDHSPVEDQVPPEDQAPPGSNDTPPEGGTQAQPAPAPAADEETPAVDDETPPTERVGRGTRTIEDEKRDAARREAEDAPDQGRYYPPPVDGPALRLPESPTRLYLDGGYAESKDLSALPFIAGRARNLRFAVGGAWRWRRLSFEAEVPGLNVTILDVTEVPGGMPMPQDVHQRAFSFGDVRLGAQWTVPLVGEGALVGGFGLRGRLASHTTRFTFHLVDGTLALYSFPYYFHVEPTAILGGALGRFTFVINQGAIVLIGPNGNFQDQYIVVPTIIFWDAHYAVGYAPFRFLGASVELETAVQMNKVGGMEFTKFNGVRAAWVAPAIQIHLGRVRIDLIARLGLNRGEDLLGVLEFVGTNSYTLRLGWTFK